METKGSKGKEYYQVPVEIKAEEITDDGVFTGMGAVFGNMDAHRDIILPGAFTKSLGKGGRNGTGVAMLWAHDSDQPLGIWRELNETKKGLQVVGQIAVETQLGHDKHVLMKMGAIKGLSIGFNSVVEEFDRVKRIRMLKELDLWEISPVTFPANVKAQVTDVKHIFEAKTPREMEAALREVGASIKEAKYLASLCASGLSSRDVDRSQMEQEEVNGLLEVLKKANAAFNN